MQFLQVLSITFSQKLFNENKFILRLKMVAGATAESGGNSEFRLLMLIDSDFCNFI